VDGEVRQADEVSHPNITLTIDVPEENLSVRGIVDVTFNFKVTRLTSGTVLAPVSLTFGLQLRASALKPWIQG
jgi:hypothetical protein